MYFVKGKGAIILFDTPTGEEVKSQINHGNCTILNIVSWSVECG